MTLKKLVGQVHLWLGLTSGLVVIILGITGCILVFEKEIKSIVYSDIYYVDAAQNDSKPVSELVKAAKNSLTGDLPITDIRIHPEQNRSVKFYAFKTNTENGLWYWDTRKFFTLYVNPYTSNVLKVRNADFEFFFLIEQLHYSLLLKPTIGKPIIGTATIIFIIMLITGLILWWPKNKKALKMNTWFQWKSDTKWRRKTYDLHNIVGFYSMFFVIFIALTGLVWAFEWFDNGVQWIANGGKTIKKERVEVRSFPTPFATTDPLDVAYHYLKNTHPEAKVFYLSIPQDSTGTIRSFVDYTDNRKDIILQFNQYNGKLLHTGTSWEEKSNGEKVRAYNYDIHTGAVGGLVGKTIAFFLALFSASLPVTGFMIWYDREKKKRRLMKTGGTGGAMKVEEDTDGKDQRMNRESATWQVVPKLKISSCSIKEESGGNVSV
ncbi:MAG: PepSY-associated TM helix domain-containing protein [Bacteroidota bacterium]